MWYVPKRTNEMHGEPRRIGASDSQEMWLNRVESAERDFPPSANGPILLGRGFV